MAHKTLIGGTGYEIKGGRTLIGGTGYDIASGRTLIGGTGYDIRFPRLATFVAASGSKIYYSDDLLSWTDTGVTTNRYYDGQAYTYNNWRYIYYHPEGGFLTYAIGMANTSVATSKDGRKWNVVSSGVSSLYPDDRADVVYFKGYWYQIRSSSSSSYPVSRTQNGVTWTSYSAIRTSGANSQVRLLLTDGTTLFAYIQGSRTSSNCYVYTSTDATTWERQGDVRNMTDIWYSGGWFVATSSGAYYLKYSSNGINWNATSYSDYYQWQRLIGGSNGMFMAMNNGGYFDVFSTNPSSGFTFRRSEIGGEQLRPVCCWNGKFYAVNSGLVSSGSYSLYSSPDGINWTLVSSTPNSLVRSEYFLCTDV